ncbi:MAG TPA: hypothetical protein VHY83_13660 [Solirubrobacteraceae bacterium]|nr:hypothetical protein [Solirubrobacteraceae bacterium]
MYEFEPAGVGSCSEPAGCLSLISTGTGTSETFFVDASPSGNDVFIREYQKLLPADKQEGAPELYDVRVNGGIAEPASPPPCTTPDACRTAPAQQPSIFGAPASQTFSGAGNLASPAPAMATPKPPTRAQLLAKALRSCRKIKAPKKRIACQKTAHRKYGPPKRSSAKKATTNRRGT